MMSPRAARRHILLVAFVFWAASYALLLTHPEQVLRFAGREKLIELLGALFLLAASLACFACFRRAGRGGAGRPLRRRFALLLLALLFFVAFGEEVSWGQHLFGFEAPETIKRQNIQGELNLHNLRVLDTFTTEGKKKTGLGFLINSNRLFDYFMVALFLIAPLLATKSPRMRDRLEALGVPLLPAAFAIPLLANLLATAVAELFIVRGRYPIHLAVSEIRESNYALLCLLAALFWLHGQNAALDGEKGRSKAAV